MKRRKILKGMAATSTLLATAPALVWSSAARAEAGAVYDDDRILGEADAKVTIIEYASLTCPHCATFHEETLPQVKQDWINEGKARLVFRHYPLDGLALRAAALSNCFEGKSHFTFLDAMFASQRKWAGSQDPLGELAQLAKLAGMDQARFDACVTDEAEMNGILERMKDATDDYDVQSTPTMIVNGKKVTGSMAYEEFRKVLEEAAAQS